MSKAFKKILTRICWGPTLELFILKKVEKIFMNAAIASQDKQNVIFLQLPYLVQNYLFIQGVFKGKKKTPPFFSNYLTVYIKV